ncbi:MAG: M23 family metallopeptidase, partial [Oscillospiraceae bacterium]
SLNFIVPISGDVITPFSGDNMIKSETLNEWVMHTGVDIKAEEGVKVKAIGNGEVVDVFNDSMWGTCVIIKHNESIESHYCNLKSATTVKKGQKVNCGDVIGEVGKTAEIESAMVSHLHFAVKSDGNYINPLSIIK